MALLIEVLRFLVSATEGSVSKLTADDTLATADCAFGHTHSVAPKTFLDHFQGLPRSGARISHFPQRALVPFQGEWHEPMSA